MPYTGLVVSACFMLVFAGCLFSPKKGNGKVDPPKYEWPSTPQIVMENLAKAYAAKDSSNYKACFDSLYYLGTTIDQTDPVAVLDTLRFADEAMHIAKLSQSTTISSIYLELAPSYQRSTDLGDPVGWALIQNPIFRLEIDDGTTQYVIPVQSETLEFHFAPTVDSRSPTDTTWKIIRWNEVRQ